MNLDESTKKQVNQWEGYLSHRPNFISSALRSCDAKIVGIFTGNQAGKTKDITADYVDRILGRHPIEWKNMRPNNPIRTIRFASEKLPLEAEGEEIINTVYPKFKEALPPYLIKKDVTQRKPVMIIRDIQGGPDINIEFVSYNQEFQSQAGVQRFSVYLDEHAKLPFFEEQIPRLLASNGDIIIGLTPVGYISWEFENVLEKADVIYNSPTIVQYMKSKYGKNIPVIENTGSSNGISVIRAATDDNPTMNKEVINSKYKTFESDIETYEIRRYGIFHQITGKILKDFDPYIHVLSRDKYFSDGIPHDWIHGRGIDFMEQTPWACTWMSLSDWDEAFVWNEFTADPDRMVTIQIARELAERSRDFKYQVNLVDPRMDIKQANTGLTPLNDLNRSFEQYSKEGICTWGRWTTWDTKNLKGRDEVKKRLANAKLVGKPFNNRIFKNGKESFLPTLWILDNCRETITSFKNWRWEDWADRQSREIKEKKNKPEQKYSHYPIAVECLFKSPVFSMASFRHRVLPYRPSGYENLLRVGAR